MGQDLLINNTAGSAVGLTTSDVAIQQGTNIIPPSSYNSYEIVANIEVVTPAVAVAQTITYKLKLGSVTLFQRTYRIDTATGQTAATIPQVLYYKAGLVNGQVVGNSISGGGTLTLTQVSTSTDATTTTKVLNLYVTAND